MGTRRYGISLRVCNTIRDIPYLQAIMPGYFVYRINMLIMTYPSEDFPSLSEDLWRFFKILQRKVHRITWQILTTSKNSIELSYSDFPCHVKLNRDKLALINRPWTANSFMKIDQLDRFRTLWESKSERFRNQSDCRICTLNSASSRGEKKKWNVFFLLLRITRFRSKAHLVFHWCLCN